LVSVGQSAAIQASLGRGPPGAYEAAREGRIGKTVSYVSGTSKETVRESEAKLAEAETLILTTPIQQQAFAMGAGPVSQKGAEQFLAQRRAAEPASAIMKSVSVSKAKGFQPTQLTRMAAPVPDLYIAPKIPELAITGRKTQQEILQKQKLPMQEEAFISKISPKFHETVGVPVEKDWFKTAELTFQKAVKEKKTVAPLSLVSKLEEKKAFTFSPVKTAALTTGIFVVKHKKEIAKESVFALTYVTGLGVGARIAAGVGTKASKIFLITRKVVERGMLGTYGAVTLKRVGESPAYALERALVELPALYAGGRLGTRLAFPMEYKAGFELELLKLPKAEREEPRALFKYFAEPKDIKPSELDILKVKAFEGMPKLAKATESILGKYKKEIAVSGSLAQRAFVKSLVKKYKFPKTYVEKFIPKDIDVYADIPLQKKFVTGFETAGIKVRKFPSAKKIDVYSQLKKGEIGLYKGTFYTKVGKAIEFHSEKFVSGKTTLAGTLKTVVSPLVPLSSAMTTTPSGIRIPKFRYLAKRALYGGFEQGTYRYSKDIPRFKAIVGATFKGMEKEAKGSLFFKEYKLKQIEKKKAKFFGYEFKEKPILKPIQKEIKFKEPKVVGKIIGIKEKTPPSPRVTDVTPIIKKVGRIYKPYVSTKARVSYPTYTIPKEVPYKAIKPTKYKPIISKDIIPIKPTKPYTTPKVLSKVPAFITPTYKPSREQPYKLLKSIPERPYIPGEDITPKPFKFEKSIIEEELKRPKRKRVKKLGILPSLFAPKYKPSVEAIALGIGTKRLTKRLKQSAKTRISFRPMIRM